MVFLTILKWLSLTWPDYFLVKAAIWTLKLGTCCNWILKVCNLIIKIIISKFRFSSLTLVIIQINPKLINNTNLSLIIFNYQITDVSIYRVFCVISSYTAWFSIFTAVNRLSGEGYFIYHGVISKPSGKLERTFVQRI